MKKIKTALLMYLLLIPVISYAGLPREPQALSQGGGGRAFNLAYSGVGETNDTASLYINPAGLAQIEDYEFSLFYGMVQTAWYNDIYSAFGIPIGKRQALAFSVRYFSGTSGKENASGDLMQYDENLKNYGFKDNQFLGNIGYGIGITDKIRFGAAMKFFYQNLKQADRSAPTIEIPYSRFEMGLDAGLQFDIAHFFSAGIHVRNAFSFALKNSPSTQKNFPIFIRPGIAFKLLNDRLIINADIGIPTISAGLMYNIGFSFRIAKWISIYGGFSNDFYGGGFDFRPFEELIFYIGGGYHKTSAAEGVNFDNGDNSRGGFIIGVGLTFIIRPPSRKINREVRDFIRAQQAMSRGNYGQAMEILQDIQRSDSNNRDLNELTQEYLRVAQRRATTTDWMTAADRARIAKYMQEGQAEYGRQKYASSIRAFRRVIDIYPAHPEANQWIAKVRREVNREATRWYQIGEKHYIAGKLADAEKALRTCLSIDPEYLPASELLARIAGGDSVAALREGIQVPRINTLGVPGATVVAGGGTSQPVAVPQIDDPSQRVMQEARNEVEKLFQLGETFYYQARYVDSIVILNKFISRSDNEELKLKARAIIVNAEQKYKQQENAQARRQRSERLYELGMAAYREQRYRDAIDAFDRSFVADTTNFKSNNMSREANRQLTALLRKLINEGVALRDQREYDGAIGKFDLVVQTDSEHELAVEAKRLKYATQEERKGAAGRHLAIARDALRNKQYQAALTNFNIVLRIEPGNQEALKGRQEALKLFQGTIDKILAQGRDELNKRNFPQAIIMFDRVLVIDRNNRAAEEGKKQAQDLMEQATTRRTVKENMEIAKLRFENRDYELALDTINKVLRAQPNNIQATELKKKCLEEIEKEKDRRKIMTLFSEGAREFRRRNYDNAVVKWTQVLALQSRSTDFDSRVIQEYIERAKVLKREAGNIALQEGDKFFAAKQYKKAKERYTEALQRSPNSNEIRLKLTRVDQIISQEIRKSFKEGETHFNEGRYDEAIKAYKRILDYETEGSELANTAKDELQRSEDALKARQKGDEFFTQKNYAEAISQFEYLIAINRKDGYAMERRREAMVELSRQAQKIKQDAIVLLNQKNYARAIILLNIVVRADPDDREAKSKLEQAKQEAQIALEQNYNMGVRAYNAQNWKVAVDAFNVVRSIDPNYKETNKFYRRALDNYNRIQSQSNAQRQGELQGLFYQGITLYRQNKLREAIAVWNRILAVDPGNDRARQYIQRARFRLGG